MKLLNFDVNLTSFLGVMNNARDIESVPLPGDEIRYIKRACPIYAPDKALS